MYCDVAKKYEEVGYSDDVLQMLADLMTETRIDKGGKSVAIGDVLRIIVLNTPHPNNENREADGVKLTDLMDELNISTYVCNEIINTLTGGCLIYYKFSRRRTNVWYATPRGLQLAAYILEL